VLTQNT